MVCSDPTVLIAGAGIAGLAAAWTLHRAGVSVQVVESSDRVGGVMQTQIGRGFLVESGPHSFLSSAVNLFDLIADLGLSPAIVRANRQASRRYIYWDGRLQPVPMDPFSFACTRLLSPRGKWRLLAEPWQGRGADRFESLAQFVRRRFGPEVLERFVGPFVLGVYAGDPEILAVAEAFPQLWQCEQRFGSVFLGALRGGLKFPRSSYPRGTYTLREGMGSLAQALADRLPGSVFIRSRLVRAEPQSGGGFRAELVINGREHRQAYQALVLATPAHGAAEVIASFAPDVARALAQVLYAPVAVVATGYPVDSIPVSLNGFGFLVPRGQGIRLLGSIWNSSLFPERAGPGMALLTSFCGGMTDPEALDLEDDALLELVRTDLKTTLGITPEPAFVRIIRHSKAIPQFGPGHRDNLGALDRLEALYPGLAFTGNYRSGISTDHAAEGGRRKALELLSLLGKPPPEASGS